MMRNVNIAILALSADARNSDGDRIIVENLAVEKKNCNFAQNCGKRLDP